MQIVLDAHLHIYPAYNTERLLDSLCAHLARAANGAQPVALLTERYDCRFFEAAYAGGLKAGAYELIPDNNALRVLRDSRQVMTLVPGYQVVTQERIEILTYGMRQRIADGLPVDHVITRTLEAGGLPALAWAPGKWFGERGGVIRRILDARRPGELVVCDSSMRPVGWRTPDLVAYARQRGYGWVAGSDPLPFADDLAVAGTYACMFESDATGDAAALLRALRVPGFSPVPAGRRSNPVSFAFRYWRNSRAK